jgi:DNA-directed RNA polymerase specialized sigma subunit
MKKKKTMAKKTSTNNNRYYFTKVHENAIVSYVSSTDKKEREKLYVELIGPALDEMVDKIVYTYKFTVLPNIDELKKECKLELVTLLGKFDKDKGSKAFSYFSVVSKNWFIQKLKKNAFKHRKEMSLEDIACSSNEDISKHLVHDDITYFEKRNEKEYWNAFYVDMEKWKDLPDLNENQLKVFKAISDLFDKKESIEIFSRKAITLYLKELTKLESKEITCCLNIFRERYLQFQKDWFGFSELQPPPIEEITTGETDNEENRAVHSADQTEH